MTLRALVIGLGNMGTSHALALRRHDAVEIVSLVDRTPKGLPEALAGLPVHATLAEGLATDPDLVVIATYPDSHAPLAQQALAAGAHVFVEKPLATTVADARALVAAAQQAGRKLVVGYILRHHPSWQRLVAEARALGGPYVFRLNLNQQSTGTEWATHRNLLRSASPIVDCGVHYVDVMCQVTDAPPVRVSGMGVRLAADIDPAMYNYGHFQVFFADGSVGWYEAGWGPMMSETAHFVKDIVSPNGAVSIIDANKGQSADIDGHTRVGGLLVHTPQGDRHIDFPAEPGHQQLCDLEQDFMVRAIRDDIDLTRHMHDAVTSLATCLAADESVRTNRPVELGDLNP